MKNNIILSSLMGLILIACTKPGTIGLELQDPSDAIVINNDAFSSIIFQTEPEDSLQNNSSLNLLGETNNDIFPRNQASFITQILLTENNISLEDNLVVDSVILSYTYSGFYGELIDFTDLQVKQIDQEIQDSIGYYSNSFSANDFLSFPSLVESYYLSEDTETPLIKINLALEFGQEILELDSEHLQDNNSFVEKIKGLFIYAEANNTVLYLNPSGSNSKMNIYYHNDLDSSFNLEFQLDGDAIRINLFENETDDLILNDQEHIYVESMAGYKAKITILNRDSLRGILLGKTINKATLSFNIQDDYQSLLTSSAHEELFLGRVDLDGNILDLPDLLFEGSTFFGGRLENNQYEFNITRYLYELIYNSSYTNELYLLDKYANINANKTILTEDIILTIFYSEL